MLRNRTTNDEHTSGKCKSKLKRSVESVLNNKSAILQFSPKHSTLIFTGTDINIHDRHIHEACERPSLKFKIQLFHM